MPDGRSYTDAEVRAILDRALRGPDGRDRSGDLSHEQLLELGTEIGLTRDAIERAALDIAHSQSVQRLEQRIVSRRRRWFGHHLAAFLAVNAFLFAINFLTTPGQWWFLFPVFSWLLPLALHARLGLSRHVSERALRSEAKRAREESPRDAELTAHYRVATSGVTSEPPKAEAEPEPAEPEPPQQRARG
ncbi:MAG: 2TM domain-containing protein [Myxococcota bacterium]